MSLRIFVSSTVEDLGPVREEIKQQLEQRSGHSIQVTLSERDDFPVEPGVTSHDACLRAIEGIDAFVLLVGTRFGGGYPGTNKSITWMEFEAALEAAAQRGVIVVPLVLKRMNDKARDIGKRRSELRRQHPHDDELALDEKLRKEFPDSRPFVDDLPAVQRFVEAIRKGHEDNWMHEWNGTSAHALAIIESRLTAALSAYRDRSAAARRLDMHAMQTTAAFAEVAGQAATLLAEVRAGRMNRDEAAHGVLTRIEDLRQELLDFRIDGDIYNFMLYRREGNVLRPGPRACDPGMTRRDRSWKVGEGHVGVAAQSNVIMVTGNLRESGGWSPSPESERSDARVYVSAISIPLYFGGDTRLSDGVFIITSNRRGHFRDERQRETLTAAALGRILTMVWM